MGFGYDEYIRQVRRLAKLDERPGRKPIFLWKNLFGYHLTRRSGIGYPRISLPASVRNEQD